MASKSVSFNRDMLADIAVKAITAVAEKKGEGYYVDLDNIQMIKKQGGSMTDTPLIEGVIVDKEKVHSGMPTRVENPKIALLDAALEIKKTEIDAKIEINDPTQLNAFLQEEENMLRRMVDQVKKSGANVVLCQKGIDDLAQHFLAKEGIYAVRRVKKSDMEKLAKATGANIVSKVSELTPEDIGTAGLVEERKIGEDSLTFVTGAKKARAVSILIRGGTEHVLDEIERSLDDALNVVAVAVEDGRFVFGGGATAEELAMQLRDEAAKVGGREQIAFESFAEALETIPRTLAENAGLDPIDILIELRKAHKGGQKRAGVNVAHGQGRRHGGAPRHRADPRRTPGDRERHRRRGHDPADRRRHRVQVEPTSLRRRRGPRRHGRHGWHGRNGRRRLRRGLGSSSGPPRRTFSRSPGGTPRGAGCFSPAPTRTLRAAVRGIRPPAASPRAAVGDRVLLVGRCSANVRLQPSGMKIGS